MATPPTTRPSLTRVRIKNYKSIAACDIRPGPLNFLVGPNGSGKSNFLDALQFISDAVSLSLNEAIRLRGGFDEMVHRGPVAPERSAGLVLHFDFETEFGTGEYRLQLRTESLNRYDPIQVREFGRFEPFPHITALRKSALGSSKNRNYYFDVSNGEVKKYSSPFLRILGGTISRLTWDHLALGQYNGDPCFLEIWMTCGNIRVFNFVPDTMREPKVPDYSGATLRNDGGNIASLLREIEQKPEVRDRVCQFLKAVVPEVSGVEFVDVASYAALQFHVRGEGGKQLVFPARAMSDGTLRTLGILVALFQSQVLPQPLSVVGIEEPETALHPAAAGALRDALMEATDVDFPGNVQVFVSTHSADLLDTKAIPIESLFAVEYRNGRTEIAPLDFAGKNALEQRRFTAGRLLSMGQLSPDPGQVPDPDAFELFDSEPVVVP